MSENDQQQRLLLLSLFGGRHNDPDESTMIIEDMDIEEYDNDTFTDVRLNLTPLERLYLGYNLREWERFKIDSIQEKNLRYKAIIRFDNREFIGSSTVLKNAEHIAATHALEYLINKGFAKNDNNGQNSFALPHDKDKALNLILQQREENELCDLNGYDLGNPISVINEYTQFNKLPRAIFTFEEEKLENNSQFRCTVEFNGKVSTAASLRKKNAQAAACVRLLREMIENGELNAYLEEKERIRNKSKKTGKKTNTVNTIPMQTDLSKLTLDDSDWE